jgi:hypothetical protein
VLRRTGRHSSDEDHNDMRMGMTVRRYASAMPQYYDDDDVSWRNDVDGKDAATPQYHNHNEDRDGDGENRENGETAWQ